MPASLRVVAVSALAFAISACGGGAKLGGGKQGAAQALFQVSSVATTAGIGNQLPSGAGPTMSYTVKGRHGGEATLSVEADAVTTSFKDFNQDGSNTYNGTLTWTVSGKPSSTTSMEMDVVLKGKVTISGAINDYVDADVTEKVSVAALSSTSGQVVITLDGSISTSSASYTYANETMTIKVDATLPAAPQP